MNTLENIGTPWAECYPGTGRFTGLLASEPVENCPNWRFVGDMSEEEFADEHDLEIHYWFHDSDHTDWSCRHCIEAGHIRR